ncbi:MAG TPA: HlyD family secretion protein [Gemmatimonadales bacterium]|jgi:membrane fusion protein (multidrug efflux system)
MANRTPIIVVSIAVVAGAIWGGKKYLYSRNHVVTDNAQVDGTLIPVAPKIQAFVTRVPVADNQAVKAGDTLLVLDARDLDAKVDQAKADLASAVAMAGSGGHPGQLAAQLDAARATAAGAQSSVTSAEANARKAAADLERIKGLAAKQIVPAQQLDAAQAASDAANAALETARRQQAATQAQIGAGQAALTGADARVMAARAALETAELQRSYAVVTAPVAGIVSRHLADPGALVQAGQNVMMLVPTDLIWVTANVKETRLGDVTVGDSVEFTVDSYGGHEFYGRVASFSPATGAKFALLPPDNATGNFTKVVQNVPLRIDVTRPLDPKYPLRPGMSVDVAITTH